MSSFAQETTWCLTNTGWDVFRGEGAQHQQHFAEETDRTPAIHFQLVHCWSCLSGRKSCAVFIQGKSLPGAS